MIGGTTEGGAMPELPDIEAYRAALETRAVGCELTRVRPRSVLLLRTVEPALAAFEGRFVTGTRRRQGAGTRGPGARSRPACPGGRGPSRARYEPREVKGIRPRGIRTLPPPNMMGVPMTKLWPSIASDGPTSTVVREVP